MGRKADIWISAIIYIGLGVVLLSIILSVGIPLINKIRDKNIAIDTESVILSLDNNIRTVYSEGPGSRRPFKFEIRKGIFEIDNIGDIITWNFETTALLSQPGIEVQKGNLILLTQETNVKNTYLTTFKIDYSGILDLQLNSQRQGFSGSNTLLISNTGAIGTGLPTIMIEVI